MNISLVNKLNNQYRALINQAEMIRIQNGEQPSKEEGLCYQNAAEISGQLATLTIGSESNHWMKEQQNCQREIRKIWSELHPEEKKTQKQENAAKGKADDQNTEKNGASGKKQEIDPEVVKSWYLTEKPKHTLDDVAGLEEAKKIMRNCIASSEMSELADYLNLPTVHSFFFYGPPGCGKTYSIKGFIRELMDKGYDCLSVDSGDIHAKFSGEADKRLKALFNEAVGKDKCVIFIDEIDGICQNREIPNLSDFNMQLTTTFLNCFNRLVEAGRDRKSIFFISATNYPSNVDTAMLDRVQLIQIPMPGYEMRETIFKKNLEKISLDDNISFADFAERSEGFSVRDIDRIVQNTLQLVFNSLCEQYSKKEGGSSLAIETINKKEFRITRQILDEVFESYKPKPNADIERSLNEFEAKT